MREQRPKPARDDKAIAAWNGLALAALAEAGAPPRPRRLPRRGPRARRVPARPALDRRRPAAPHVPRRRGQGHRLPRGLRRRRARAARAARRDRRPALARGGEPTGPPRGRALRRTTSAAASTSRPPTAKQLVARKKDLEDQPTPSGNSMLAFVLLQLARIYGDDELERLAVGVFRLVHRRSHAVPAAFGHALTALDLHFSPPRELAIVGPVDSPVARAALEPFAAEHGRRRRPVGRDPAPGGQRTRRRQARGLRVRALCLPGARHRRLLSNETFTASLQSLHGPGGRLTSMAVSTRWTRRWRPSPQGSPRGRALRLRPGDGKSAAPRPAPTSSSSMTDDQTVESMRVMPNVQTLLANQGVTFDNSFVSYSLCCPSRATFLTGQYAHNHGVWGNAAPNGGYYKLDCHEHAPRLAPARRLPDDPPRQVPEPVRHAERPRDPAGLGRVVRDAGSVDLSLSQLHDQRERDARELRDGRGRLQDRRRSAAGQST